MSDWIVHLQKCKLELEAQDTDIKVSKQQMASKMLRGAGLPQEKKAQVHAKIYEVTADAELCAGMHG